MSRQDDNLGALLQGVVLFFVARQGIQDCMTTKQEQTSTITRVTINRKQDEKQGKLFSSFSQSANQQISKSESQQHNNVRQ
jgi:hypothetical protein